MAYELQRNFSAGEVSPKVQLRNDLGSVYHNSVAKMRNMLPEPWGPATSRKGFEFIEELPFSNVGRLFDFAVSFGESYIVAATEQGLYVVDKLGFVLKNNLIQNSTFGEGSTHWNVRGNVQFGGSTAKLIPNAGQLASVRQFVPLGSTLTFRIKIQTLSTDDVTIKVGSLDGGDDMLNFTGGGPSIQVDFTASAAAGWIEIIAVAGGPNISIDVVTCQEEAFFDDTITFPAVWSAETLPFVQEELTPNQKTMYFTAFGEDMWKLTREDDGEWIFEKVQLTFGSNPDPWPEDGPGTIAFHEGRMFVGGSIAEPATIWGSKAGEYENFDFGDPLAQTPGDALKLPLDKHGEIQWLLSNKVLAAGMDTGEHIIYGIDGPIDVDNAQTKQQSAYGSTHIHAMVVNEQIAYIDPRGRIVRAMDFNDNSKGYVSNQLSFYAEHITRGFILDAAYGSSPFGVIWCSTADGDLLSCLTEKDIGTVGWSRHDVSGEIISVTVLQEAGYHTPWILVKRGFHLTLERYAYSFPMYVDGSLFFSAEIPQTEWPGFEHLADMTVQIVADRAIHPDVVVSTDGVITTNYPVSNILAGLAYRCELTTLPKIALRETGNTFSHMKSWANIVISVLNSSRPIVNGEDLAKRHPVTPMDTGEPLATEYLECSDLGYDFEGRIEIVQDAPIPLTILGVGGKLVEDSL